MMMTMTAVTVFLTLALVTQQTADGQVTLSTYGLQDASLDDVIFTEDVSFDVSARSKLDCARQCVNTANCASFTYQTSDVTSSCRGYTRVMTSNSSSVHVTGARGYALKGKPFYFMFLFV